MKVKLLSLWENLRSNYWFIPVTMALASVILANVMVEIDKQVSPEFITNIPLIYQNTPQGEREVLSTIAGSMITVAGVSFSIVIVVLALASQQFGPRLVGNFMRDRGTQIVLGTFIATFLYCLLVLRTISGIESNPFTPVLSALVGVVLAVASLGVLIYFIHHMSASIQMTHILEQINARLMDSIDTMFPEQLAEGKPLVNPSVAFALLLQQSPRHTVKANNDGYLRFVSAEKLLELTREHSVLLRLCVRPGEFVVEGDRIAEVWCEQPLIEGLDQAVNQALVLGASRTGNQDTEYYFLQFVEVAIRALSSGINDPMTAMMCIDRLEAALCRLASRQMPSPYRYDQDQQLRVVTPNIEFSDYLNTAFHQIRRYGSRDANVIEHLLRALQNVHQRVSRPEDARALRNYAALILESVSSDLPAPDRTYIEIVYEQVLATFPR